MVGFPTEPPPKKNTATFINRGLFIWAHRGRLSQGPFRPAKQDTRATRATREWIRASPASSFFLFHSAWDQTPMSRALPGAPLFSPPWLEAAPSLGFFERTTTNLGGSDKDKNPGGCSPNKKRARQQLLKKKMFRALLIRQNGLQIVSAENQLTVLHLGLSLLFFAGPWNSLRNRLPKRVPTQADRQTTCKHTPIAKQIRPSRNRYRPTQVSALRCSRSALR